MRRLTDIAAGLDSLLRNQDFAWNRTARGPLDRHFGVERHTPFGLLLPVALIFFLWCGPVVGGGPRLWYGLASVVSLPLLVGLMRFTQRRRLTVVWDLLIQLLLFTISIAVVIRIGAERPGSEGVVYQHVVLFGALVFGVSTLIAILIARWAYEPRETSSAFRDALPACELFASTQPPEPVTWGALGRGLISLPQHRAPHVLLFPAIAALLSPGGVAFNVRVCVWFGAITLIVNAAILLLGEVNERLGSMITITEALFFRGTSLIVSGLIILLAALRLLDIDYVTTLLDSEQTSSTLTSFLIAGYVLSWWYDYWVSRLVSDQLLRHLGPSDSPSAVAYKIAQAHAGPDVPADNRFIEIEGANRFVVVRRAPTPGDRDAFQPFGTFQIFHRLARAGGPACAPAIERLTRHRLLYAYAVTLLPMALLGAAGAWLHFDAQLPERTVGTGASTLSAPSLLFDAETCRPNGHVIAIAASGGGTRAAVFTSGLLEGLQRRGLLGDVRLVSGVSGGGAALAYFAARRPQLMGTDPAAWDAYLTAMTSPFIADVLEGLGQWRVTHGTRLGTLLDESFMRRWSWPGDASQPPRLTLGDVREVGAMWNTSIAGRFAPPARAVIDHDDMIALERAHRSAWTKTVTGRLVVTNLALEQPLDTVMVDVAGADKPEFVVVNDPNTPLTTAAALNANFPPVFSNAAVDLNRPRFTRYWVTDGGALDNSGLESLLYVLRQAIARADWSKCATRPAIDVVTVDAGAYSDSYTQDRGVSTALGAGTVFATRLASELAMDIRRGYPAIRFHYVELPKAIRRSGSFGTHWMLQPNITITLDDGSATTLSGGEVVAVVRALFSADPHALTAKAARVYQETFTDFNRVWDTVATRIR